MINRPRITALKIDRDGHISHVPTDLMRGEPGIGAYHYLSCGTCEDQFGCGLSDETRNSPPRRWIDIERLGMNRRMKQWDKKPE
jgi:hypothetical protein